MQRWLKTEYPKIKKMAQMQGADFYFGDAAHMRSDHHAGRTWGKKGETPVVETTGARHGISLISAITSKGHMRFMIKESGGVNADVFIEFLKRLLIGAKRKIFLIVDRGPAHRAKKTKAFVETLGGQLMLFFLPPYSPDRSPDELVWKHLKPDTVGARLRPAKSISRRKLSLQCGACKNALTKYPPFTRSLHSGMPPECEYTYVSINRSDRRDRKLLCR